MTLISPLLFKFLIPFIPALASQIPRFMQGSIINRTETSARKTGDSACDLFILLSRINPR